jgi:hypothetical protein
MKVVNSLSGGRTSSYMAIHYPASINIFALVEIEDRRSTPKDKKLVQRVSDKIGHEFIATAEDDLTLLLMFDLEQILGREIQWVTGVTYDRLLTTKGIFGGGVNGPGRLPSWARRYCTSALKIVPIFEYCFKYLLKHETDSVKMGIGYRIDEERRTKHFTEVMHYPIGCKLIGQRRRIFKDYRWRTGYFPLIENKITSHDILEYWKDKPLVFPPQSNCVGCFHKDELSINLQWQINPEKLQWFSDMEKIGKGTWKDSQITYDEIKEWQFSKAFNISEAGTCDSGSCTD